MTRFTRLRDLLTRARAAGAIEAARLRLEAGWLCGRMTDDEYWAAVRECLDAKAAEAPELVAASCEGREIPF